MALLDEDEEDVGMEDPFFPGSDEELGAEDNDSDTEENAEDEEKCMYLSKRASLIFGSEPDFCRGQDGATSSSTTAHLRWVHLWKKDV